MTEPPYILTTVIRQRPGTRATRRHYQLKVPTNDGYYWRLTATKLRHLCDAAGDALDTGAGTVGPFHVTCDASDNYTVLEGHKQFELPENDLIDLIAQGDELISSASETVARPDNCYVAGADISPDNE